MNKFKSITKLIPGFIPLAIALAIGKGGNVIKDALLAKACGRGDATEAYFVAFSIPTLLVAIFAGGVQLSLTPAFLNLELTEGRDSAAKLLAQFGRWLILVLFCVAMAIVLLGPRGQGILFPSFAVNKQQMLSEYLMQMGFCVATLGISQSLVFVLNSKRHYLIPGVLQSLTPVSVCIWIFAAPEGIMVRGLGWATLAGSVVELGTVVALSRHYGIIGSWARPLWSRACQVVRSEWLHAMGSLAFVCLNAFIDQVVGGRLAPGSVATLGLASRVILIPLALAGVYGGITFPVLATSIASHDFDTLNKQVKKLTVQALLAGLLLSLVVLLISPWLVEVLFVGGKFTRADHGEVVKVLNAYALQIPAYIAAIPAARALSALGRNRVLMGFAGINMVVNLVGDFYLASKMGAMGIALTTSLVYTLAFLQTIWALRRAIKFIAMNKHY